MGSAVSTGLAAGSHFCTRLFSRVGDKDFFVGVNREAGGFVELPAGAAGAPESGDEGAVGIELLDPVVAGVSDILVPARPSRDALGMGELPVPGARASGVP